MNVLRIVSLSIAILFQTSIAQAQEPGFFGAWVMDPSRSESAMQAQPSGPVVLVITDVRSVLVVEEQQGGARRAVKYEKDGAETVTILGADKATGRMRVEGGKLITETLFEFSGVPLRQSQTFSLSADRRELVVESNLTVVHGYEGQANTLAGATPNYVTGKDVFLRR